MYGPVPASCDLSHDCAWSLPACAADLRGAVDLRAVRRGEVVEERAHRVLQLHDEGRRVRRRVRRDVGEHVRGRRVHGRAPLEALLDRGRVHRRPVVELHVRSERERVGLPVGRDRPLRRERALERVRVRLVADEALVHRRRHGVALELVEDVGVGHLHVGAERDVQRGRRRRSRSASARTARICSMIHRRPRARGTRRSRRRAPRGRCAGVNERSRCLLQQRRRIPASTWCSEHVEVLRALPLGDLPVELVPLRALHRRRTRSRTAAGTRSRPTGSASNASIASSSVRGRRLPAAPFGDQS